MVNLPWMYLQKLSSYYDDVDQWDEENNEIVRVAKEISAKLNDMAQYARNQGLQPAGSIEVRWTVSCCKNAPLLLTCAISEQWCVYFLACGQFFDGGWWAGRGAMTHNDNVQHLRFELLQNNSKPREFPQSSFPQVVMTPVPEYQWVVTRNFEGNCVCLHQQTGVLFRGKACTHTDMGEAISRGICRLWHQNNGKKDISLLLRQKKEDMISAAKFIALHGEKLVAFARVLAKYCKDPR